MVRLYENSLERQKLKRNFSAQSHFKRTSEAN